MSEPLSDEELGGKCSVVNLLHPTGIHFKSPTCEGWFAITAHPTPEKKEHFRQERWESVIHGFDGTLAEHHDDPCYICDHDVLTTQLAEMTRERDEAWSNAADAHNDLAFVTAQKNAAESAASTAREANEKAAKLLRALRGWDMLWLGDPPGSAPQLVADQAWAISMIESALAALSTDPQEPTHADWCNVELDNGKPCDCGGNGGACDKCGAVGPCAVVDGIPLICAPQEQNDE